MSGSLPRSARSCPHGPVGSSRRQDQDPGASWIDAGALRFRGVPRVGRAIGNGDAMAPRLATVKVSKGALASRGTPVALVVGMTDDVGFWLSTAMLLSWSVVAVW